MGRRVYGKDSHELEPGDYGRSPTDGGWICAAPLPRFEEWPHTLGGNLRRHDVVEHGDGTITVSPSIEINRGNGDRSGRYYHGFLERGIWRTA